MILVFVLVPPALVIAGAVIVASYLKPRGSHAFTDPADRTDPYGEKWTTLLRDPSEDDLWEQRAGEMATGAGQFPMLPPDPEPDPTLVQAADVKYLGKPSGELVDELFAKHAPKPDMLP